VRLDSIVPNMGVYYKDYSYHGKINSRENIIDKIYNYISRVLLKPVSRYVPQDINTKILDVGCSTGNYLYELKKRHFKHLKGIEASEIAVHNKVSKELDIICTSLSSYNTEEKFDLITLNQVFEHFENPRDSLLILKKLLNNHGMLVMSFPNYNSLARLLFGSFWPGYDAPRHYFTYNPRNFGMLCNQHGLKIEKVKYISRPSQFLGGFQYLVNTVSRKKQRLETGFFRNSKILDMMLFIPAYCLNLLKLGDNIEIYIKKVS